MRWFLAQFTQTARLVANLCQSGRMPTGQSTLAIAKSARFFKPEVEGVRCDAKWFPRQRCDLFSRNSVHRGKSDVGRF